MAAETYNNPVVAGPPSEYIRFDPAKFDVGARRDDLANDLETYGTSPSESVIKVRISSYWLCFVQVGLIVSVTAYLIELVLAGIFWVAIPSALTVAAVGTGMMGDITILAALGHWAHVKALLLGAIVVVVSLVIHGAAFAIVTIQPTVITTSPAVIITTQVFAGFQWGAALIMMIVAIYRRLW